jgi:hypothetical protein
VSRRIPLNALPAKFGEILGMDPDKFVVAFLILGNFEEAIAVFP